MNKTISIVTIVLNDEEGIEKTIQSVLSQTSLPDQFIIKDGGSRDGTTSIIKKYLKDYSFIEFLEGKDNGVYDAMNIAIDNVVSELVIFMNAGDYFHSNTILEHVKSIYQKQSLLYGDMILEGVEGWIPYPGKKMISSSFCKDNINHQSVFFNSEILKNKYHGYNLKYKYLADQYLIRQYFRDFTDIVYLEKSVAVYNLKGISSKPSFRIKYETYLLNLKFIGLKCFLKSFYLNEIKRIFKNLF
ncbi:MAG: glycosyltransferase [Leptospiraceae bacterium]|nr:glycosyltransferase [Leptospiraceae bacterium]